MFSTMQNNFRFFNAKQKNKLKDRLKNWAKENLEQELNNKELD